MNFFKKETASESRFGPMFKAILLTGLVVAFFVVASFILEGPTLARRTLTSLGMPMGVLWLGSMLLGFRFAFAGQLSAAFGFAAVCVITYVTGNPYVSSQFMSSVQWPEVELDVTSDAPLRTVIALGGGVSISPSGTPEIGNDGERIFSSAQLWHAGLTQSIICTGATPDGLYDPSDVGEELLLSAGVPAEVIFKVGGETTTGEMRELKAFFDSTPEGFPESGEVALITSAFHMGRAMRLAEKNEFDFMPFPCAFRGTKFRGFEPSRWVPSAGAAADFGLALKERIGVLMGR